MKTKLLTVLCIGAAILDYTTTVRFLTLGTGVEANPLIVSIIASFGFKGLAIAKGLGVIACFYIPWCISKYIKISGFNSLKTPTLWLVISIIMQASAGIWNIITT